MLNEDMHRAVAFCIASPHEDLHEVTSISSCADLNSQSVVPSTVPQKKGPLLGIQINNHGSFSSIILPTIFDGLQTVPPTNLKYGQIHHNLRINFGIHNAILNQFFIHHDVLNQFFIHHDVLDQFFIHHDVLDLFFIHHDLLDLFFIHHDLLVTFPSFPPFLTPQNLRIHFPNLTLENVETCPVLNQLFNSLLLRSPASCPRYTSNTSLM